MLPLLPLLHLLLHLSYFILFVLFAFYFAPILSHPTCTKSYNFLSSLALVSKKKKTKKILQSAISRMNSCVRCVYRTRRVCSLGDSETFLLFPLFSFSWKGWILPLSFSFSFYEQHARFPSTFPPRYECKGTKWARHKESQAMLPNSHGYTRIYDRDFLAHFVSNTGRQVDNMIIPIAKPPMLTVCVYTLLFALPCTYLRLSASVIARCCICKRERSRDITAHNLWFVWILETVLNCRRRRKWLCSDRAHSFTENEKRRRL